MVTASPPTPAPTRQYLTPIDPAFMAAVQAILGNVHVPISRRRKEAGEQTVEWLAQHGRFIRTGYGEAYYLYATDRRLYRIEEHGKDWASFLYLLTGCNPVSVEHRYLYADAEATARQGELREVIRVAHWDHDTQVLRVSRYDGTIYRLDGWTIETEGNGDGPVLFDDDAIWQPYLPDFHTSRSILDWSLGLPNWTDHDAEQALLYQVWWLATFFSDLCPTKPILLLRGERGSGKTLACRVLMQLLFGPALDVYGLPEKEDAFIATLSNSHVIVLDNLDTPAREIQDRLASIATGKLDGRRTLYETNGVTRIRYRCWIAVTSRFPDTLQRPDLVDRTLALSLRRLVQMPGQDEFGTETSFLQQARAQRDLWWGELLTVLSQIVAEIRRSGTPTRSRLRMADWTALGSVIARSRGLESFWPAAVTRAISGQIDMLLDDPIVQAIDAWLSGRTYTSAPQPTRALYEQCQLALFGSGGKSDDSWPRSARSFGRRLSSIHRELREYLQQQRISMAWRTLHGQTVYEFTKLP